LEPSLQPAQMCVAPRCIGLPPYYGLGPHTLAPANRPPGAGLQPGCVHPWTAVAVYDQSSYPSNYPWPPPPPQQPIHHPTLQQQRPLAHVQANDSNWPLPPLQPPQPQPHEPQPREPLQHPHPQQQQRPQPSPGAAPRSPQSTTVHVPPLMPMAVAPAYSRNPGDAYYAYPPAPHMQQPHYYYHPHMHNAYYVPHGPAMTSGPPPGAPSSYLPTYHVGHQPPGQQPPSHQPLPLGPQPPNNEASGALSSPSLCSRARFHAPYPPPSRQ
jgi:hypothetical protein